MTYTEAIAAITDTNRMAHRAEWVDKTVAHVQMGPVTAQLRLLQWEEGKLVGGTGYRPTQEDNEAKDWLTD